MYFRSGGRRKKRKANKGGPKQDPSLITEKYFAFLFYYMALNDQERIAIGHNLTSLVRDCSFAGTDCLNDRWLRWLITITQGNQNSIFSVLKAYKNLIEHPLTNLKAGNLPQFGLDCVDLYVFRFFQDLSQVFYKNEIQQKRKTFFLAFLIILLKNEGSLYYLNIISKYSYQLN